MTERPDQFYVEVLHRIGRVFATCQLDQAECVALCAQLTALAIHSNVDDAAQRDQLEKTIVIIRERHRALVADQVS